MAAIALKKVTVYVEGSMSPIRVYPAQREPDAQAWANKVQAQIKDRGWNHVVRIENA